MTLRWYHWAAIAGGALWFMQWRKAAALTPGNAEAAGENVSGQSASGGGFSQILGNLISALSAPPASSSGAASSSPTSTAAVAPSLAPSPVLSSPVAFVAASPAASSPSFAPGGLSSLVEAQQTAGGM